MSDTQDAHYFKIGLFVLLGVILLVGLIALFSTVNFFQKQELIETYFSESVQGLSIGSPVKYRGIIVGTVKEIDFVKNEYNVSNKDKNTARYVYVLMSITSRFLTSMSEHDLQEDVHEGLRVKLALQDLTGNAYVEINFTNPTQNRPLPIYWKPEHTYIPSAVSTFTRFADSIQNILHDMSEVNFPLFFKNAEQVLSSANQLTQKFDRILTTNQGDIVNTFQNMDVISNNLRTLSNALQENPSKLIFNRPQPINPADLR